MAALIFITHPEVTIDPATPVERWRLSDAGVRRMRLFAESGAVKNVASVWASGEAKAIEVAAPDPDRPPTGADGAGFVRLRLKAVEPLLGLHRRRRHEDRRKLLG